MELNESLQVIMARESELFEAHEGKPLAWQTMWYVDTEDASFGQLPKLRHVFGAWRHYYTEGDATYAVVASISKNTVRTYAGFLGDNLFYTAQEAMMHIKSTLQQNLLELNGWMIDEAVQSYKEYS